MNLARGQVWEVALATKVRAVVIVESDAAIAALPGTVVCAMVDQTGGAPDTVVTVPVHEPVRGTIVAVDLVALTEKRIRAGTYLGIVEPPAMTRLSAALRVVLDLTD